MVELIIGTYGVLCWLLFKKFKVIPVTTYTIITAILGVCWFSVNWNNARFELVC